MLEVFFSEAAKVLSFLKALDKSLYQEQLKSLLSEKRQRTDSLSVTVKLYLTVPIGSSDAKFIQVTAENHRSCLDILHEGAKIDYRKSYPDAEVSPVKEVLDVEDHLSMVSELTANIVQWYSLGVFLRVSQSSLERVKLECGGCSREGLVPMFREWMTSCPATWPDLFQALCRLGYRLLAQKIAARTGWVMVDQHREKHWPFEVQPEVARQYLPMLEEREKQIRCAEKEIDDTKDQLKSLSSRVLENEKLLQVTNDATNELAYKKEELFNSLAGKQKQHEELISRKQTTQKTEHSAKLAIEIEQSIREIRIRMERLDAETHQLDTKKSQFKHEAMAARRQAKECRQALKNHEEQLSQLTAMLSAERTIFDLQVQLMKTAPDNVADEQAAQITFLKEEIRRKDMHKTSKEVLRAHLYRLEQQQQSTLEGDTSQLSVESEGPSSIHNKSIQSVSSLVGLPIYLAVEVPSPRTPSSTTPPHPIPKLTSFKEATRGLESSSGASKRVTSLEHEEKEKSQEQTSEECSIIDPTPLSGAHSLPNLTPFRKATPSDEFNIATLSKCKNTSEEDRKKFLEELIQEYEIIDASPLSDMPHTPKLTLFKEEVTQSLEGSLVVVTKSKSNPEEIVRRIVEEYDIIDLTPPKEIML